MRLNTNSSQPYVIGSPNNNNNTASSIGNGELPRFDGRPVLKQAKSALAYSSNTATSMSSRVPAKSSFSMSEAAGMGRMGSGGGGGGGGMSSSSGGFFRGRNQSVELPLTSRSHSPEQQQQHQQPGSSKARNKVRAAVSGRDGVLPDWSRTTPSPTASFNNNYNGNTNTTLSPRRRTSSEVAQQQPNQTHSSLLQVSSGMNSSMRDLSESGHHNEMMDTYIVDSDEERERYAPRHHQQQQQQHPMQEQQLSVLEAQASSSTIPSSRVLRQRKPMEGEYQYLPNLTSSSSGTVNGRPPRQPNRASSTGTSTSASVGGASNSNGNGTPEDSPYRPLKPHHRHRLMQRLDSKTLRTMMPCFRTGGWNLTHVLQTAIFLLVTFLLYDSHHKANLIATRLKDFKSEEAMLFLHLHRITQQSIQLHEGLQRLDSSSNDGEGNHQNNIGDGNNLLNNNNNNNNNNEGGEYLNDSRQQGYHNGAPNIDSALIQKQTQQLMQMEEELSHEVRTLQTRIQHSAVRSIVHEYGEGPVQVIWEVVVDGVTSKISILLWHDTPHAAWTWLEQISRKLWDGAEIHLENNRILNIGSAHPEVSQESHLDFIERSQQRHEAWTVGLAEPVHSNNNNGGDGSGGGGGGGLQVFINLQDNTEFSKHNVCVGKVFDGFDVLHKMVEQSRGGQGAASPITIRSVRASHLTNRETKGLI